MIRAVSPRRRKDPLQHEQELEARRRFGARLADLRKRASVPQDMAALLAGVPVVTYQKYEQGVNPAPVWLVSRLAEVFGQPASAFHEEPGAPVAQPVLTRAFILITHPGAAVDETLARAAAECLNDLNERFQRTHQTRVTGRTGTRKR